MHRVGAHPDEALALAGAIGADPHLGLGALWTHLAVADGDDPDDRAFTALQLERFDAAVATLSVAGHPPPMTHVANSAGTIGSAESRHDLVRCGLAVYGLTPTSALASALEAATGGRRLRPVLSLRSRVTYVRDLGAGERLSYGRRRPLPTDATVATVPIGYADGVPRRLFDQGGEVLIGGVRRPLAGVVTMDQIVVDCGPVGSATVAVGDEVVLSAARVARRSPRASGPTCSAPSATRCSVTSAPGSPVCSRRAARRLTHLRDRRPTGRYHAAVAPGSRSGRTRRGGRRLHPVPPGRPPDPGGLRSRRPDRRPDVRRRGARARRGPPGRAVRGPLGQAARPAGPGGAGHRPFSVLHRQRGEVPAPRQPRPPSRGDRRLSALPRSPARAASTRRWWSPSGTSPPSCCSRPTSVSPRCGASPTRWVVGTWCPPTTRLPPCARAGRWWPRCGPTSSGPSSFSDGAS